MIMEQENNQAQLLVRPEFDKLKVLLTKINDTALEIQDRQKRIINTADGINSKLKSSIEDNIKDVNAMTQTEERIKNLQGRIDKSKKRLTNIREKFLKLKELHKKNKAQKEINENKENKENKEIETKEKKI